VFLNSSKCEKAILSVLDCAEAVVANSNVATSITRASNRCDCDESIGIMVDYVGSVDF
jgi:hypothetical protein